MVNGGTDTGMTGRLIEKEISNRKIGTGMELKKI